MIYLSSKMENKNHTIDFLRFIAAAWVALFHFNEPIAHVDNWYRNFVKMGALGVPIFFVISGYCIGLSASRAKNAADFLVRRFFRILPPYWFSLLVVIGSVITYKLLNSENSVAILPKSIIPILATLTLSTSPLSNIPTINWVYWSLTVELFFYLAAAISVVSKKRWVNEIVLLLVSLVAFSADARASRALFFLEFWPAFGIGMALFYFKFVDNKKYFFPATLLLSNGGALFYINSISSYSITVVLTFLLIALSTHLIDLPNSLFSKLGDLSYSVYLLHVPLGVYILGNFRNAFIQNNLFANVLFDLLIYLVISVFAFYTYKYVELPSIQAGKKLLKKLSS